MRYLSITILSICILLLVSCGTGTETIEDEDIKTNSSLEQHRIMDWDKIEDFKFTLKSGWKLAEPNTDRSRWVFKDGPLNGQYAYLTVEVIEGDRYFYRWDDIKQQLANEIAARMFWAMRYGTNVFRFHKDGQRYFEVGNLLKGWMVIYHDYADRDAFSGMTAVYAQAGIWEMKRQIIFKLVTTPKGWGEYWADNFREIVQSCRSMRATNYQMERLRNGLDNVNIKPEPVNFIERKETINVADGFNFDLQNTWIWVASENGKHTFSRELQNGEPAILTVEPESGDEYFYKASNINEKLDKILKDKMADTTGKTNTFKLYNKECELFDSGNVLKGWKVVYEDYDNRFQKNFVFVDSAVWELKRQIKFKMSTTPKGWNSEYSRIFNEIVNSCRSEKIK